MVIRIITTLLLIILTYNFSYAGVDLKNIAKVNINAQKMVKELSFYALSFRQADPSPIIKFCALPKDNAVLYLENKLKAAQSNYIAAYHYGMLAGFAPCIDKKPQQSLRYLMKASRNGITKAGYLIGLLLLKDSSFKSAKNYFKQGTQALHAKSAYNYALIHSKNFKIIDQETLKAVKIAASEGQDFVRHDAAIAQLKAHITKKSMLNQTNFIRIQNIIKMIITTSNNDKLKNIAKDNLVIIEQLQGKPSQKTAVDYSKSQYYAFNDVDKVHFMPKKDLLIFLERQSIEKFNTYMHYR